MNVGRSSSCIGENVTYVCNITSFNHIWIWIANGSIGEQTLIPNSYPRVENGYILRVVLVDGNNIALSSLSVNSSAGLNGTIIKCEDGVTIKILENRTAVAMVLGECV